MEEDQQNLELQDNQLVLKDLLINKPDESVNDGASSSNEEKNKVEESKDSRDSPKKEEKNCESKSPAPERRSPDPSCAICLEQLQNKSFTDSCFHMFCFTCLLEWSKVKPECPLCKQSFSSIVHNVRSLDDFDQYHVRGRIETSVPVNNVCDRRFRYGTTLTFERLHERHRAEMSERFESEMASHRMRYAPHSVHSVRMYPSPQIVHRLPCMFRRRIYENNLWVQPLTTDRIRCASPAFFSRNIACTHRLLPWLNRELLVVMPNNESQISFVIELIMSLIVKYHITSQEFYTHIEPYIAPHTSHFIHEFYNFATSPYDIENYDHQAQYSNLPCDPIRTLSSPDSDVIPLPMNDTVPKSTSNEAKRKKRHSKKKHTKEYLKKRHLKKLILKRNSMNNCWETVMSSVPLLKFNDVPGPASYEIPGPSTSRDTLFPDSSTEVSNQDTDKSKEIECLDDDDDDEDEDDEECQIVKILKPKWERTPEIVDLSSDDELKNDSNIITVPSDDDDDDTMIQNNISSFFASYTGIPVSPVSDPTSDDDDIIFIAEKTKDDTVSDKPIDYSLKTSDKKVELESKSQVGEPSSSSSRDNIEGELSQLQNNPVLQSAIRALSNDNDTGSSWSPLSRPKKRRAAILDDSSTESCSESAQVSELDTRIKKLKLRSVVAHFSCDPSDDQKDSSHKSSHRRHKDKKKKKKKHKRKHRIYSSDSN